MTFRVLVLGPAAALSIMAAAPLHAQIGEVPTPSGLARVVDDPSGFSQRLLVGDRVVAGDESTRFVWIEAQVGSLLLVGLGTGGSACPATWTWVNTAAGNLHASETFGTCSDLAEVSWDQETVTVTMPSYDADHPTTAFVYDGRAIREVAHGQVASGAPPQAGADGWIGRYPYEFFKASDWRGPLIALLGQETYDEAQDTLALASPMEVDGEWVAGAACRAHMCDVDYGAVAIHRGDGRLLVALRQEGGPPRLWGEPRGALPGPIQEVMSKVPRS